MIYFILFSSFFYSFILSWIIYFFHSLLSYSLLLLSVIPVPYEWFSELSTYWHIYFDWHSDYRTKLSAQKNIAPFPSPQICVGTKQLLRKTSPSSTLPATKCLLSVVRRGMRSFSRTSSSLCVCLMKLSEVKQLNNRRKREVRVKNK